MLTIRKLLGVRQGRGNPADIIVELFKLLRPQFLHLYVGADRGTWSSWRRLGLTGAWGKMEPEFLEA